MAQAKRKQRFFDVELPILKKETQLYAFDIEELKGRTVIYDLTRLLRGKSVLLKLNVTVTDGKASATPKEMTLLPYYLRRMIRKGTSWVEDSFDAPIKESKARIKLFLVTRKKVSREVRKALREKAREETMNFVKEKTEEQLFEDLLQNRIQKHLSTNLKKIYPLSLCEVRFLGVHK